MGNKYIFVWVLCFVVMICCVGYCFVICLDKNWKQKSAHIYVEKANDDANIGLTEIKMKKSFNMNECVPSENEIEQETDDVNVGSADSQLTATSCNESIRFSA